jgi:hypothetical protein
MVAGSMMIICSNYSKTPTMICREENHGQNRLTKPPNIACRLTCCHIPFRGFFSLEKHFPFRELVRVATRS